MDEEGRLGRWQAATLVGAPLAASAVLGALHPPTPADPETFRWYQSLHKPSWTPPGAVIGAVWTTIEAGLAYGGYRLLRQPANGRRDVAFGIWAVSVTAIGGWSELFFGGKKLGLSALAAAGMVATGAAFIAVASKVDRKAAATGLPFVAWLGFATVLATEVWRRNRDHCDPGKVS